MKVSYRREVLISTRQFENTRIAVELADESPTIEGHASTFNRLRDAVNNILVEEIAALETGNRRLDEATRHDRIRQKYGL